MNSSQDDMPSQDSISARARRIWEQAGRPEGKDLDHWLRAERELRGEGPSTTTAKVGAAPASPEAARDADAARTPGPPLSRSKKAQPGPVSSRNR